MELPTNKRIEYIDALRGATMILVVYSHIAYWCLGSEHFGYNDIFIKFRMPLFFFISGWVFYKTNRKWNIENIKEVIKKKFLVQIIPFLIFLTLFLCFSNSPLCSKSCLDDKYGYWFTFSLFEYFIIYIIACVLFNKLGATKGEGFVIVFLLLLSCAAFYYEQVQYTIGAENLRKALSLLSFTKIKYIIFFGFGTVVRKHFNGFIQYTDKNAMMTIFITAFSVLILFPIAFTAYSGDTRSPIPVISVHSVGNLQYRRQS